MARALALAERGRGRTSPNPMVGAVVVDGEGVVVGRGAHEVAGGPHAEVYALEARPSSARSSPARTRAAPDRAHPWSPRPVLRARSSPSRIRTLVWPAAGWPAS